MYRLLTSHNIGHNYAELVLGHFLELEVILEDSELPETGIAEARLLMKKLGIDSSQLVDGTYVDLLPQ